MRTYGPVPETVRVWMPPVPVVVEKIEVQFTASGEVWIWNALPYAVSQFSLTWQIVWLDPRSTWSHCGSLKALDQRVPGLPSKAAEAGVPAFSIDDAVAGWVWAGFAVPAPPPPPAAPNTCRAPAGDPTRPPRASPARRAN